MSVMDWIANGVYAGIMAVLSCIFLNLKGWKRYLFAVLDGAAVYASLIFTETVFHASAVSVILPAAVSFGMYEIFQNEHEKNSVIWNIVYVLLTAILYILARDMMILLSKLFYGVDPSGTAQMSAYYRFCLSAVIFVPLMQKITIQARRYRTIPAENGYLFAMCFAALYAAIAVIHDYVLLKDTVTAAAVIVNIMLSIAVWLLFRTYYRTAEETEQHLKDQLILQQLQAVQQNAGLYEKKEEEIRIMKHDLMNRMLIMDRYIREGEYDRCSSYIQEQLADLKETPELFHTGYTSIDAILSAKSLKASQQGIFLSAKIDISSLNEESAQDSAVVIASILDAAIESSDSRDPEISLLVTAGHTIDISVRGSRTKDGILSETGMRSIRYIAEKYEGEVYTDTDDTSLYIEAVLPQKT